MASQTSSQAAVKAINDAGGFVIAFSKVNKSATVLGIPNAYAEGSGFTGIGANEIPYVVVSGNTQ